MVRHRRSARRGFAMPSLLKLGLAAVAGYFVGPIAQKYAGQIPFVNVLAGAGTGYVIGRKTGALVGAGGAFVSSSMGGMGGSSAPVINQ